MKSSLAALEWRVASPQQGFGRAEGLPGCVICIAQCCAMFKG